MGVVYASSLGRIRKLHLLELVYLFFKKRDKIVQRMAIVGPESADEVLERVRALHPVWWWATSLRGSRYRFPGGRKEGPAVGIKTFAWVREA